MSERRLWTARAGWLLDGLAPPRRNVRLVVEGTRLVAVEPFDGGQFDLDFGDGVVVPGFVNAHTHLEFGALTEPTSPRDTPVPFAEWLRELIAARRAAALERSPESLRDERRTGVVLGLDELSRSGVTMVGEIARPDWPEATLAGPVDTLVFLELLGLSRARVEPLLAMAKAHLNRAAVANEASGGAAPFADWQAGLSPHAPYTVHPDLLAGACRLSLEHQVPIAMHLAESWDELELLRSHSGALVETLREFDAWDPSALPRGLTPSDYLQALAKAWKTLVVHGNFLSSADYGRLAEDRERMSVVYCPRTHSRFVPTRYPLAEMLAAGVRVVLGTDSRATNPDLDFLAELRWVASRYPEVDRATLLRMATTDAAIALGLTNRGALIAGQRADFVVLQSDAGGDHNPWEWLESVAWIPASVCLGGVLRSTTEKKQLPAGCPG